MSLIGTLFSLVGIVMAIAVPAVIIIALIKLFSIFKKR